MGNDLDENYQQGILYGFIIHKRMKTRIIRVLISILLYVMAGITSAQNIAINSTGAAPVGSAVLDLSNNLTNGSKAFLGPYVSLTGTNDAVTVTAPLEPGLIVYNTNTVGGANAVSPGYYYYTGTSWAAFYTGTGAASAWNLTGNTGTNPGVDFVGTTDTKDLVFKTDGTENMRILNTTGNVGIGTTTAPRGGIGAARFAIHGTDGSVAAGPHFQITTSADNYPLFQQLSLSHDVMALVFDAYYDGTWRSSTASTIANFEINKSSSNLYFAYALGASAGSALTWKSGITLSGKGNNQGNVGIGNSVPDPSAILDLTTTNNRGLLPPQVALAATNSISPFTVATTPATGLIVYNTATTGTAPNNVIPGYYYYTGSKWVMFVPYDQTVTSGTNIVFPVTSNTHEGNEFDNNTTGAYNTNSTNFTQITGSTITISTEGTYMITATAEVNNSSNNDDETDIVLEDVTNGLYYGNSVPYIAYWVEWETSTVVTLTGSTTYEVKIASQQNSRTAYARNVRITYVKLQ
jgi:hypothetical protein